MQPPHVFFDDFDYNLSDSEYTATYDHAITSSTTQVTVTITGKENNFTGSVSVTFAWNSTTAAWTEVHDISEATLSFSPANQAYTGTKQNRISVNLTLDGTALTKDDFDVAISGDSGLVASLGIDETTPVVLVQYAGTYTITMTGKGAYTGTRTAEYVVTQGDVSTMEIEPKFELTFTGINLVVNPLFDGVEMDTNDYDMSPANILNAGTHSVTFTGKRYLTGTKTVDIRVAKANIATTTISVSGSAADSFSVSSILLAGRDVKATGTTDNYSYAITTDEEGTTATITGTNNLTGSVTYTWTPGTEEATGTWTRVTTP